jgi:imidazolonepropionase-like amidohydrolase
MQKERVRPGQLIGIVADNVIDGRGRAIRGGAVIVDRDRIVEVGERTIIGALPTDASLIELGHRTVMPGLIDAHVHFYGVDLLGADETGVVMSGDGLVAEHQAYRALRAARDARRLLSAGFTTVRCLGSNISPYLARAAREHVVPAPRILYAGDYVSPTGGTWDVFSPLLTASSEEMIADGVSQCRQVVRKRIRQGADVIKIGTSAGPMHDFFHAWGDSPYNQVLTYTVEEVRAIVDEAHRAGIKVSSHSIGDSAVQLALEGGVDVIEHGHGISDATRQMLVERRTIVVSTLSLMHFVETKGPDLGISPKLLDVAKRHAETQRNDFRKALEASVRIASGSDFFGPPWAPHGSNATELVLMSSSGMSNMQAIQAATGTAAEAVGLPQTIGTLEKGKVADVIAVAGDPSVNIRHVLDVEFVMQGGVVLKAPLDAGVDAAEHWL